MSVSKYFENICPKKISECSDEEIYISLIKTINEFKSQKKDIKSKKKLYYISAEFLIGKLLISNLMNLGIYNELKTLLSENGKDIDKIEELEAEPSLGNGGLGRLAACFLDSIASLNLSGDGIGICYHLGLFKQKFINNKQVEIPNPWIDCSGFLNKQALSYTIDFKNFSVNSVLYDIDIIGASGTVNKLHLFDISSVDEKIVRDGIEYMKKDIEKNLTLFLYPDDSDTDGKYLRIYQQYFMVANAARFILSEAVKRGSNLYDLPDYAVIQINDTHPSMIIPELIYLLNSHGVEIDTAIDIVKNTCAYTNHTILAEALERWPISYISDIVPHLTPIIEILDNKVRRKFDDSSLYIIDKDENINMAKLDIHYTFSTNGVAALHTDILKENELNNFYRVYPERFNNKTNGITFRRWLSQANPELEKLIISLIGDTFKKDSYELKKINKFIGNNDILEKLIEIKHYNKLKLKEYIKKNKNIVIDENSIYDVQIKRLHEYKRQQLNLLYIINKYLEIKKGIIPKRPITAIFGAKAAPAYTIAKDIIHLILCLEELINNDKEVSKHLKVVMIENYNVTSASIIIPAADISEQISLASKEASGTGNMKLMLNGAVTIGTKDGANVEILQLVGDENIYIFGDESEKVIERYKNNSYKAIEYYEKIPELKEAVDFITSEELLSIGDKASLERLKNELINKDWFMTFPDYISYKKTKDMAFADYEKRLDWANKMLCNISYAGYFSSDRTIMQYNSDIWKLN